MMMNIFLSIMLLTLISCSTSTRKPNESIGVLADKQRQISTTDSTTSAAVIELEQMVHAQPDNPELLFNLAMAYLGEDKANSSTNHQITALANLNKVLELVPGNIATLKAIYNIHYENTMTGKKNAYGAAKKTFFALPVTQRTYLNPPSLAKFVHLYINSKQSTDRDPATIYKTLLDASIEHPTNAKSYIQLAKMYSAKKYYPLALATLKLGEELIKSSPELYLAIATTYETRAAINGCQYEQVAYLQSAIDYYKRAISLQPENTELHSNLAQLYLDNNLHQLALHETAIVVELDPSATNLAFAAQNYSFSGNQKKAAELLHRASNAGLASSDAVVHETYMNAGQWKEAALSFTDYLQVQQKISVYDFIKADIIGQQADIGFAKIVSNKQLQVNNEWKAAIFAFWTNKITRAQLEKNATNRCELTEYLFYSGYRNLQAGNKTVAKQQFTSAMNQKTYRFIERPLARHFLTLN